ncbi:hypothetical protein PWR63_21335 [Paraburkholderia sp. A2WS-5]|uniref:hypothetical protein n=1 Tax=unclassified Paraburkholderia TaxID=2615204 RepID=UPI003B7B79F0
MAAESVHEPARGTVDAQDAKADISVESLAANTAEKDIANTVDTVSGRSGAPLQSHDAEATATHMTVADNRGDAISASVSPGVTDARRYDDRDRSILWLGVQRGVAVAWEHGSSAA